MAREYLKKAPKHAKSDASEVHETVVGILNDIEAGGDAKALEYAHRQGVIHRGVVDIGNPIPLGAQGPAQAEGQDASSVSADRDARLAQLEKENRELRRANVISGLFGRLNG